MPSHISMEDGVVVVFRRWLHYLALVGLIARHLRGDMIEVFKITHNIYDRTVSLDLPLNERANTSGNHYKLQNHTFHYDLRKHFFLHAL